MTVWQPIETAPKDSSILILCGTWSYSNAADRQEVFPHCKWREDFSRWGFRDSNCKYSPDGFSSFTRSGLKMTHWMPLPEPPLD